MRYYCLNCNYKFEAEKPIECPYCGEERIEKEKDADELLGEV